MTWAVKKIELEHIWRGKPKHERVTLFPIRKRNLRKFSIPKVEGEGACDSEDDGK